MDRLEIIKSYYEPNMGKDLPDYCILGWESEEAQHLRFGAVTSNLDLNGLKILDVGCGMGNFFEYLNRRNITVHYTGVDILQSMIECARMKNLGVKFYECDIFNEKFFENESFDLVFSSGIFNLNLGNNGEFLVKATELFLDLSSRIVAFNLLHEDSPDKEEGKYCYFNPDKVKKSLEECFSNRLNDIKIVSRYLKNDFTVICYKK